MEQKLAQEPLNNHVGPLLTDLYQLTMAYAYWKNDRHNEHAVFDLFFRKNPFKGEFTVFAGLDECIRLLQNYRFTDEHIEGLKKIQPNWPEGYFDYLRTLDGSQITLYAIPDGTVVFPRVPLMRVEGPLGAVQLLETTLLCLVNYACLMTTNAARHRLAAGSDKTMLEFGLRRAQGPDGAMSASKYAYVGGFDGTSNVEAAVTFDIPVKGTHAHSFVSSFTGFDDLKTTTIPNNEGEEVEFLALVHDCLQEIYPGRHTNAGELAAFVSYAQAYPSGFLALVDTYDTLNSGVPNFLAVSLALHRLGYRPIGIRLDSGDLAYQSRVSRQMFRDVSEQCNVQFENLVIVASNDISEKVLHSLNEQGHEIDSFGIGTHLVTCKAQPALGGVFKLVEINGTPRIKISQEVTKVTIPGKKNVYRLYNRDGAAVIDLMTVADSEPPQVNQKILCRHPFSDKKRAYVIPSKVEPLYELMWDRGEIVSDLALQSLDSMKERCAQQIASTRDDHLRQMNPTPYKVSLTDELFKFMHELWEKESEIPEIL